LPIVFLYGERGTSPAFSGELAIAYPPLSPCKPTFTRVALPISTMDPAWVLILDGRLKSSERVHGKFGPFGTQSEVVELCGGGNGDASPKVVTEAEGEDTGLCVVECSSPKGSPCMWRSRPSSPPSLTTSAGPNDPDAKGEPTDGREAMGGGFKPLTKEGECGPGVLITSALTTPTT
jgi:hypothetical protein